MHGKISFLLSLLFFCSGCNHLFYYPRKDLLYPPENFKIKYEKVEFLAQDSTKLTGWFFPAKGKTLGTIVQFHGNAENMTSHYLSLVWLTEVGYNLFTFDYRGYGSSEGEPTQKGTVMDGAAALKTAFKMHKSGSFIIWGQSLGGAIAQASITNFPDQNKIDLIALESTFNSYRKVAASVLKKSPLLWILSPLPYVLISDRYANLEFPKKNRIPVLIAHDENDPTVPFSNGEDLFNRIQAKKTFWRTQIGGHLRIFTPDQESRRRDLIQFLATLTH